MKIIGIILLSVMLVFVIWLLLICRRSKKPVKCLLFSAILGLACLITINLLSGVTGIKIPINVWTAGVSGVFSLPGVIGLLVMNIII